MTDPGNPKKRNGYWWTASRFLAELDAAEAVGLEATRRTVATLGSRKVDTQECAIVFDPEVARSIVGTIFSVANGSSFWRKSSYLVGREGTLIASPLVTIVDDPLIRARPARARSMAMACRRARTGRLRRRAAARAVHVYSGRKLGASRPARPGGLGGQPGADHVESDHVARQHDPRRADPEHEARPLRHLAHGLRVQRRDRRLSRGRAGLLDRERELTFRSARSRFAANFDEILKRIDAVADDIEMRSSTVAPTFASRI